MKPRQQKPSAAVSAVGTDAILESISDRMLTVDRDRRILSFNRAAEQITGVARKDAIGRLPYPAPRIGHVPIDHGLDTIALTERVQALLRLGEAAQRSSSCRE